jgi:hypothetical protein
MDGSMSHRVNILLDDRIWKTLKKVPKGARSTVVNDALAQWFSRRARADAVRRMDALRANLPDVPAERVAEWGREDRERNA